MAKFTDDYLLYLLAQTSAAVSASFHASLAREGVAVSTWRILASLYPDERLTVSELAQSCMAKQPTMTRMIDRLCMDGLVERHASGADRRRVHVNLTEAGRTQAAALVDAAQAHEAEIMRDYSLEERATLVGALRILRQNAIGAPSDD